MTRYPNKLIQRIHLAILRRIELARTPAEWKFWVGADVQLLGHVLNEF